MKLADQVRIDLDEVIENFKGDIEEQKREIKRLQESIEAMNQFYTFIDSNMPPDMANGFREVWAAQRALLPWKGHKKTVQMEAGAEHWRKLYGSYEKYISEKS